ncbi:hypothetical protein F3Y22_tig00008957pilonHSYRG00089 [Hibiscus syriacus]|uniref:Uncharacterized protein n=1 Tax=Hibiscus syriacus TaxID=106335 RepID=A0A6A3C9A5_HIBSY|nr:hypothetical protein F3Y22_tig00008957pilonHSYRG00089 [Hibiscus syriacus]
MRLLIIFFTFPLIFILANASMQVSSSSNAVLTHILYIVHLSSNRWVLDVDFAAKKVVLSAAWANSLGLPLILLAWRARDLKHNLG